MKTRHQPLVAAVQAVASWPMQTVLAMNICLLTRPDMDVQRWFEEQVIMHLGHSPHGGRATGAPIV